MSQQFYESKHGTIHVSDNPHKMLCGRVLKEGKPLGVVVVGEWGIWSVVIPEKYVCPDCKRKGAVEMKHEEYWLEIA